MNESHELKALEEVQKSISKLREAAIKKADKEKEKDAAQFITIKGEKVYTEDDIFDFYAGDQITQDQSDRYAEKLEEKKSRDRKNGKTLHEVVSNIYLSYLSNIAEEIEDIKYSMLPQEEKAREEN